MTVILQPTASSKNDTLSMLPRWLHLNRHVDLEGVPWPGSVLYSAISRSRRFTQHYQLVADDLAHYCHDGRVLDVGTGPGWLLLALSRSLPGVEVVGVDISSAMVSVARKNIARAGCCGSAEVRQAGAEALPFPDDSFDAVVSTASLHHWNDPAAALNEVRRVLKPGGYALMYDLVSKLPPAVRDQTRAEFGLLRFLLRLLHSLQEPLYSPEEMAALALATHFWFGRIRVVGVMCCLVLQKGNPTPNLIPPETNNPTRL